MKILLVTQYYEPENLPINFVNPGTVIKENLKPNSNLQYNKKYLFTDI